MTAAFNATIVKDSQIDSSSAAGEMMRAQGGDQTANLYQNNSNRMKRNRIATQKLEILKIAYESPLEALLK